MEQSHLRSHLSKLHLTRSIDTNRTKNALFIDRDTTLEYGAQTSGSIDFDSESVIVSFLVYCNGLFYIGIADHLIIWNPFAKKLREIPNPPLEFPASISTWAIAFFGLGYHAASNDCKMSRIAIFNGIDFQTEVKIYSRNSDTWRRVGDFPYDYLYEQPGVFAAGCLHWIASVWEGNDRHHIIVLLDLADDSYRSIRLPEFGGWKPSCFDIGTLDGKLVMFCSSFSGDVSNISILEEHGRAESWTTIRISTEGINNIEAFIYFQLLCFMKPDRILLHLGEKMLAVFCVAEKRRYDLHLPNMLEGLMVSYVESLVSPDAPLYVR